MQPQRNEQQVVRCSEQEIWLSSVSSEDDQEQQSDSI